MKCGVNHLNVLPRQNLQRKFSVQLSSQSLLHLSDRGHVAGAAVVLRGVGGGGGAAGGTAAEGADRPTDRALVVEDVHRPAVGSHGVVHEVDCVEQDTGEGQA